MKNTCTHPDHNDAETCEDRAVACSALCGCCLLETSSPEHRERIVEDTKMHARTKNATCWGYIPAPGADPSDWDAPTINYTCFTVEMSGPLPSRELCDAHNEGKDWPEHIYYFRDHARYMLTEDRAVLFQHGDDSRSYERVEDEQTIALVFGLEAEDRAIDAAREQLVQQIAEARYNSNRDAIIALKCAIAYRPKDTEPMTQDGIDFWAVGHNASHGFYMGFRKNDDGSISLFSGAEAYDDPFSYQERNSFSGGYYGHH